MEKSYIGECRNNILLQLIGNIDANKSTFDSFISKNIFIFNYMAVRSQNNYL